MIHPKTIAYGTRRRLRPAQAGLENGERAMMRVVMVVLIMR